MSFVLTYDLLYEEKKDEKKEKINTLRDDDGDGSRIKLKYIFLFESDHMNDESIYRSMFGPINNKMIFRVKKS